MKPMKEVIETTDAPAPIGPYSVGIKAGNLIFTAGQIGIVPGTGELVEGGVQAETRQALSNLTAVLAAAGVGLDAIVKTTVFLRDIKDFGAMNAIYGEFFTENFPARSALQVGALPKGAAVEIESIAVIVN